VYQDNYIPSHTLVDQIQMQSIEHIDHLADTVVQQQLNSSIRSGRKIKSVNKYPTSVSLPTDRGSRWGR
jgi:hypothetical protein